MHILYEAVAVDTTMETATRVSTSTLPTCERKQGSTICCQCQMEFQTNFQDLCVNKCVTYV